MADYGQRTVYYEDICNGRPRLLLYYQTLVPRVIPDLPVSPPCSPRSDGGDDHDDVPGYDMELTLHRVIDWRPQFTHRESAYRNKRSCPRNSKQKNISKSMRRLGKLKQPGGASCNQRR